MAPQTIVGRKPRMQWLVLVQVVVGLH